ncbi:MAG TPA: recombinase family protein, partial [Selenomonas sp.]|nr:recombinase family protein [Selenomonas sp.]
MFTHTTPSQAAVYCRVSSEAQQERQTIENQIDFARKYCDLNNIEITEIYKDDGITGTLPLGDRPAGSQLLRDAQDGKFKLLLIFKLDRLGRSTRVILNAVHDLDGLGVLVRSMTEPFDTSNPSGKFLLTILAGVADLERSNILQRMDMGAMRAAKEGKWLGGIVPYGYIKGDDGFLQVNNEPIPGFDLSEPDVLRMIFDMCANEGATSIQISDHLNALRIPPAWVAHNLGGKRRNNTRGTWGSSRILRILRSSTYYGIHEYGKRTKKDRETITRPVPAIVDYAVWRRAQAVVKGNQIDAIRNAKHKYLLKSIVKCESCGATYRGNPAGRKSTGGYYSCGGRSNWRRMGRTEKCQAMSISMTWLDDFVWNDCLRFINDPGLVVASIEESEADKEADLQTEALLESRLAELDADKERMLDLYRQKIISMDDVAGQMEKIKKDRETVQAELDELKAKHNNDQFFGAK